ncbi:MAG: hypothetical protein E4H09_00155 [Spirochaetales bacterium]|nr:MAG: hypothetical protein E4H09_00155 [Spirochaetales bacterium]
MSSRRSARETRGHRRSTPRNAVSVVADDELSVPRFFPDTLEYGNAAITFDRLLGSTSFAGLLRRVLARLQEAYGVPVDVEFACRNGKLVILQCRPLAQGFDGGNPVLIPEPSSSQRLLFDSRRDIFRSGIVKDIRYVVMVDNARYHNLPDPQSKAEVARVVGRINRALKGSRFILIGPGRWGSSNLDLGVKVGYGEINNASVLVEIADASGEYTTEVSYGTHFFQDLIEADIIPLPLFPGAADGETNLGLLLECTSCAGDILPKHELPDDPVARTVTVVDLDASGLGRLSIYLNAEESRGVGLLG